VSSGSNSLIQGVSLSQWVGGNAWTDTPWLAFAAVLGGTALTIGFMSLTAMVLVYAERKIAAHFQCRLGAMRVGWHGILQSIADSLKLFFKEDIVPTNTDHLLHALAPALCVMATLLALITIPLSPSISIANMNIGVLFLSAVSGLGVLGILLGGWSSNNKWSLLGAMRAGAQIISYEISMTLSILVVVLFAGSMKFSTIIESQATGWWIWRVPVVGFVAFFIFLISSTAEINRTPFDLAEGESELTAGFHTEYSGLRFAMFFLAEYINLFIASSLGAILFLGGWMPFHIGHFSTFNHLMDLIPPGIWFAMKVCGLIFLSMWIRWTFPRLRVDQLMRLEWKILLPIGLVNLAIAACLILSEYYFFVWNPL
jgi:NADH-quinone oxidoreductase subunit H